MATGKKPLREAASSAPGRSQKAQTRSKVARRRAAAGALVALLLIGGLAVLFTRGGEGIGIFTHSQTPTPQLTFATVKVVAATTTATTPDKIAGEVKPVGKAVELSMRTLFEGAFIDPAVWDGDHYDDLFSQVMDEGAAGRALQDVATVTLGSGAGDVYASVKPDKSKLIIKVLTDAKDKPVQAIAQVTFRATATHDDGTFTKITVTGSFFFHQVDGAWRIFSYDVKRQETPFKPPSPTASSTPTAEATQ